MEQSEHIFSPCKICIACAKLSVFFFQILQYLAKNVSKCLGKVKTIKAPVRFELIT